LIADIIYPDWARWMARDQDGSWWCYEAEPHQHDTGWYENEVGRSQRVNDSVEVGIFDWRDSLRKINPG